MLSVFRVKISSIVLPISLFSCDEFLNKDFGEAIYARSGNIDIGFVYRGVIRRPFSEC